MASVRIVYGSTFSFGGSERFDSLARSSILFRCGLCDPQLDRAFLKASVMKLGQLSSRPPPHRLGWFDRYIPTNPYASLYAKIEWNVSKVIDIPSPDLPFDFVQKALHGLVDSGLVADGVARKGAFAPPVLELLRYVPAS